jgi:hypothetical protein
MTEPGDLAVLERNVANITLPNYDLPIDEFQFMGYQIPMPLAGKANVELAQLQIGFKLSEDMKNYLYLFVWMQNLKYGDSSIEEQTKYMHKYYCNELKISMLDNQKRTNGWFRFTNVFPSGLSALPLRGGVGDNVEFNCNFAYQEFLFELNSALVVPEVNQS